MSRTTDQDYYEDYGSDHGEDEDGAEVVLSGANNKKKSDKLMGHLELLALGSSVNSAANVRLMLFLLITK